MAATTADTNVTGFQGLSTLLLPISADRLRAARRRVSELERDQLLEAFRKAYRQEKRLSGLILSDELTERGIPPAFRYDELPTEEESVERRFDAFVFDLRWLRRRHRDHPKRIRYTRYRDLFAIHEPAFQRAAEYVFYGGKRPTWKIIASLSVTIEQQWEFAYLRSAPIRKHFAATQSLRHRVTMALREELRTVRRTSSFTETDAAATLERREALWICSRMTNGSPSATALRYEQMTGTPITRQAAAKQLEKVREALRRFEMNHE
jgi:hypothetical protein